MQSTRSNQMISKQEPRWRGFTLVELLVVIAIIGVLVALLLPAVQAAREASRRAACSNKLRQLGIALHNHHDTTGRFPVSNFFKIGDHGNENVSKFWGWLPQLLPSLEQSTMHDQIDFTKRPHDPVNLELVQTPLDVLTCPSSPYLTELGYQETINTGSPETIAETSFAVNIGDYWNATGLKGPGAPENIFFGNQDIPPRGVISRYGWSAQLKDITDGTSSTFALGEVVGHWCINQDFPNQAFATTAHPINFKNEAFQEHGNVDYNKLPTDLRWNWAITFRSFHPGGAHFLMCDSSAGFISEDIDHFTYMALASREGEEVVNQP